jgi:hypothetical protein
MSRLRWLLLPCAILAVLTVTLAWPRPITFGDLEQAQDQIAHGGYCCTSDRQDGQVQFGFMVTRVPTDWTSVAETMKVGALGPNWRGKVWIARISSSYQLASIPEATGARIWGSVIAFGDSELLAEIEQSLWRT